MSTDELEKFLGHIWGAGGTVFLAHKNNPTAFDVPPAKRWPEDKENIIAYLLTAAARGKDVYFSPAIFKNKAASKHKVNVDKSRVLWVDIDGTLAQALAVVQGGTVPRPTYRVCTGREGHEHWYWLLDQEYETAEFEKYNKRIAYHFGADHCWNADRVLRPPFTKNFKDPKNPLAVDIVDFHRQRYSLEDFNSIPEVQNVDTADRVLELRDLPSIADVLGTYKWNAQHLDLFKNPPDVQGSRDQSLMRVAYYMAETGMPDEAMYVMLDDMSMRMGKFVGRADRKRRLADMIVKARAKHPYGESKTVPVEEDIQQVFTLNELLDADFKLEWMVEDLLAHRSLNIVEALPGTGKSRLTLQWAEALASGGRFLDWEMQGQFKVMYLSLEMDRYFLKHFAESLTGKEHLAKDVSDNFILVPVGEPIPIGTPQGMEFVEYLLDTHKPQIVFIDALGSLTEDELQKEQVSKNVANQLNKLVAKYDVCFILVHHLRKDQQGKKGPPTKSDTFGSQYVAANSALILALWAPDEQDNSHIELLSLKNRGAPQKPPVILDGSLGFKFVVKEDADDVEDKPSFVNTVIGL